MHQIDHDQVWRGSHDDAFGGGNETIQRIPENDYDEVLYEEEERKYHKLIVRAERNFLQL